MRKKIVSLDGVSYSRTTVAAPWRFSMADRRQNEREEISIACRRCIVSRGRYQSEKAAKREGWRHIKPYKWPPTTREHGSTHRGLCGFCRKHPEESP